MRCAIGVHRLDRLLLRQDDFEARLDQAEVNGRGAAFGECDLGPLGTRRERVSEAGIEQPLVLARVGIETLHAPQLDQRDLARDIGQCDRRVRGAEIDCAERRHAASAAVAPWLRPAAGLLRRASSVVVARLGRLARHLEARLAVGERVAQLDPPEIARREPERADHGGGDGAPGESLQSKLTHGSSLDRVTPPRHPPK